IVSDRRSGKSSADNLPRNPSNGEKLVTKADRLREAAESKFKKKELRVDAAMAAYEAASVAIAEKTAHLRALRLARDAAVVERSDEKRLTAKPKDRGTSA